MTHLITVRALRDLLDDLQDDDVLTPNAMGNLAIHRDGQYFGFIDLREGHQYLDCFDMYPPTTKEITNG
jgi:hypothetical protein